MILAADGFEFAHPEGAMWFVAAAGCALLLASSWSGASARARGSQTIG